jgi:acyl-CoA reductase-like NAD-dependent aldehyde dehydrogenase
MTVAPERNLASASVVRPWLDRVAGRQFINGEFVRSNSDALFSVTNPASGEPLMEVPEGDVRDVDAAVSAARNAFETGPWPQMLPADRSRCLWRFAELIAENAVQMALLETLNVGKPIKVTTERDVPNAIRYLQYFAGWCSRIEGRQVPVSGAAANVVTIRQPIGVCGLIVPWNFPLSMAVWKLAPALAAGCTMVLKPSEFTPLSALFLAELAHEAGFPAGVVNVLVGTGARVGSRLSNHPEVSKVAFTGSTKVGREVLRASADTNLKKVSLELGGKSPHILFADADLKRAIPAVVGGVTGNSGQNCVAGTRLLVERTVYRQVVDAVVEGLSRVRVDEPLDPETDMGPLISQAQLDRVGSYVEVGVNEGAEVLCGGGRLKGEKYDRGYYFAPTVLAVDSNSVRVCQEEIFGPVLTVIPFDDKEDAIRIGNDSSYGLAAGIWTRDASTSQDVSRRLQAGVVWVNLYGATDPAAPFGGWKESGHGREGGFEAIELYTELKTVWTAL